MKVQSFSNQNNQNSKTNFGWRKIKLGDEVGRNEFLLSRVKELALKDRAIKAEFDSFLVKDNIIDDETIDIAFSQKEVRKFFKNVYDSIRDESSVSKLVRQLQKMLIPETETKVVFEQV